MRTRTPSPAGSQSTICSSVWIVAPYALARVRCAAMQPSGSRKPPSGCKTPAYPAAIGGREALADLLAGENFVRQVVDPAGSKRTVEYLAARHADLQRAGDVEHTLARVVLQFAP